MNNLILYIQPPGIQQSDLTSLIFLIWKTKQKILLEDVANINLAVVKNSLGLRLDWKLCQNTRYGDDIYYTLKGIYFDGGCGLNMINNFK